MISKIRLTRWSISNRFCLSSEHLCYVLFRIVGPTTAVGWCENRASRAIPVRVWNVPWTSADGIRYSTEKTLNEKFPTVTVTMKCNRSGRVCRTDYACLRCGGAIPRQNYRRSVRAKFTLCPKYEKHTIPPPSSSSSIWKSITCKHRSRHEFASDSRSSRNSAASLNATDSIDRHCWGGRLWLPLRVGRRQYPLKSNYPRRVCPDHSWRRQNISCRRPRRTTESRRYRGNSVIIIIFVSCAFERI